jgi:hypothetical protein
LVLVACLATVAWAGPRDAHGQQEPPANPEESAKYHTGPIWFTPTLEIRNVGVDTNVFNDASEPKQDFVASFGPAVEMWTRFGRSRLNLRSTLQYDYFRTYSEERAFGTVNHGRYEVLLDRFTPFLEGSYDNTSRRASFEIDARARYETDSIVGGTDLRLSSRTALRFKGERGHVTYDEGQTFDGSNLANALNREDTAFSGALREALTPLTTLVVTAEQRDYRFDFSHERDTDSFRIVPGFEFKPGALISGRASLGYVWFSTLDHDLPDFQGVVSNVEVAYTARATRFQVNVVRDPNYSYELEEPYYILTDAGVQVTERVTAQWDLVGRVSRQWLNYQQLASSGLSSREDRGWHLGMGTGWWVGTTMRIGVDADYVTRESPVPSRTYDGWRVGGNLTYGRNQ